MILVKLLCKVLRMTATLAYAHTYGILALRFACNGKALVLVQKYLLSAKMGWLSGIVSYLSLLQLIMLAWILVWLGSFNKKPFFLLAHPQSDSQRYANTVEMFKLHADKICIVIFK